MSTPSNQSTRLSIAVCQPLDLQKSLLWSHLSRGLEVHSSEHKHGLFPTVDGERPGFVLRLVLRRINVTQCHDK